MERNITSQCFSVSLVYICHLLPFQKLGLKRLGLLLSLLQKYFYVFYVLTYSHSFIP